jgi:two-component system, response regulator YesN
MLIVEDELLEREFLRTIAQDELRPADTLLSCDSGDQAVLLAKQHRPDIIIMDVMLPEMDGLTAISEIRKFLPNACIAILSAYSDFSYAQKAINLRVFEYLLKPVKPTDFKLVLQRMLKSVSEGLQPSEEKIDEKAYETKEDRQYFIEEAIKYINDHFKDRLTLEMVASKVFVNPKYFSHVFKKEMGVAFTEYVIHLKIQYACKLLETTNFPAYRISLECGFSDPSYFNRVFCAHMHTTPHAYRKYAFVSKSKEGAL